MFGVVKRMKRKYYLNVLLIYNAIVFFFTVLNRDNIICRKPVRLDLFQGYIKPIADNYNEIIVNIVLFIPIGLLIGFITYRFRIAKVLLGGLMVSLTIECSQLIWEKGIFDVDDLFNNTLGALIGGMIAVAVVRIMERKNTTSKTDILC